MPNNKNNNIISSSCVHHSLWCIRLSRVDMCCHVDWTLTMMTTMMMIMLIVMVMVMLMVVDSNDLDDDCNDDKRPMHMRMHMRRLRSWSTVDCRRPGCGMTAPYWRWCRRTSDTSTITNSLWSRRDQSLLAQRESE